VEALAARGLDEALEAEVAEPLAQLERGERDVVPAKPDVRIEVEHHQIRALGLVGVRAPGVDLERAELRERDQAGHVVDRHVLGGVALRLFDREAADRLWRAGEHVLLEEAGLAAPLGAAHQRERPVGDVRQHPVGDHREVRDELALGEALLGEQHLVEVGQREPEGQLRDQAEQVAVGARAGGDFRSGSRLGRVGPVRLPGPVRRLRHLLDRPPRDHARGLLGDDVGGIARRIVAALEQEPALLLAGAARLHEVPAPVQLLAAERERQPPLLHRRAGVALGLPRAVVPHDDGAAAVLTRRDHALEVGVVERVILGPHGEPALGRREARALGHRPRPHHALVLEPEVVVHPARGVLLDDERASRTGLCPFAAGLGGLREVAHRAVLGELGRGCAAGHLGHEQCRRGATARRGRPARRVHG
jgi:hypothetical protein